MNHDKHAQAHHRWSCLADYFEADERLTRCLFVEPMAGMALVRRARNQAAMALDAAYNVAGREPCELPEAIEREVYPRT